MRIRNVSLYFSSFIALVTAAAHALVGQAHLNRILSTSAEKIDSAVMFAVWHMVTITLFASGTGLLLLVLSKKNEIIRVFSLITAVMYCLFGIVFVLTALLYSERTLQWIPMLIVSIFCFIGYKYTEKKD